VYGLQFVWRPSLSPVLGGQLYKLLFRAARLALKETIESEQGFDPAGLMVLHTWNQQLEAHAHVHAVVPGGGPALVGGQWKQAIAPDEINHACNALRVCCVAALRYGGANQDIIAKLGNSPELCDYVIDANDQLKLTVGNDGELLPFAKSIIEKLHCEIRKQNPNGG